MRTLSLLNTSLSSSNLGDQIITDSVMGILESLFPDALVIHIPTHDVVSTNSYNYMRGSEHIILGGTNLLSSNMNAYNQWKVSLWDTLFMRDVVLMGAGWWQYQKRPNAYTRLLYRRILHRRHWHSVRDAYTEKQLRSAGIEKVLNTACPTMWSLSEAHCARIPRTASDAVVVTFTEYNQSRAEDQRLVELLKRQYQRLYFWPQQPGDYGYMEPYADERVTFLAPSLKALDKLLADEPVDYVGTRLHAGIRALQHGRRALILAVDNRAAEIAKDTQLPVVSRYDLEAVEKWITTPAETRIVLPTENIARWKEQFQASHP